jgi:hypothetical protein
MITKSLLVATLVLVPGIIAYGQTSAYDSTLAVANRFYNTGAYESAELTARRLMEQGPLSDSVHIEAEQIVAFSLVAQGKTNLAADHFLSILAMNPSFELDPVLTSPKILAVFSDAKLRFADNRRSGSLPEASRGQESTSITFRAILFPGWEQYYRGRTDVGVALAGAGVVSLGSAIMFEILRAPARREYLSATLPSDIASKYSTYSRYYRGEVYSFIAFAAVYVASDFDVFLNNGRKVEIQPSSNLSKGSGLVLTIHW